MKSVYLCVNPEKEQGADVIKAFEADARELGISLVDSPTDAQAIISIGGDGTFLYASHLAVEHSLPVAGVNLGRYGFLPSYDTSKTRTVFEHLVEGTNIVETSLISAQCLGVETLVVNEVVIERKRVDRAIRLEVAVVEADSDKKALTTFVCDGAIVATPIGSTAYAASVGGPCVTRNVEAMVLTFAALHHPKIAPVVCGLDQHIVIIPQDDAILACDGKCIMELEAGVEVVIAASEKKLHICEDQPTILERVTRI